MLVLEQVQGCRVVVVVVVVGTWGEGRLFDSLPAPFKCLDGKPNK